MDTALHIAQRVASMIGFEQPSTLHSTSESNAPLMLALLNRSGQVLASKRGPFGESWPELVKEYIITTTAGVRDYALPQDFANLITESVWDRSTYREAPGPLTPQEYQRLQGGLLDTVALTPRYRLSLNEDTGTVRLKFDPIPSGAEQIAFEYISTSWARESAGSPIALRRLTEDTHLPVFPEHLMELDLEWRVRKSQGLSYRTDIAEFEMERERVFSQKVGLRDVYMAPNYEDILRDGNVPESGFGDV